MFTSPNTDEGTRSAKRGRGPEVSLEVLDPRASGFGLDRADLAPRLTSLSGETIGLVWNAKPNGDVGLMAIGEILTAEFGVKTKFYSGATPVPSAMLELVAEECTVAVLATADCGACSSWSSHDAAQLERMGIPAVIVCSQGFEENVRTSGAAFGLPQVSYVMVESVYNNIPGDVARRQSIGAVPALVTELLESSSKATVTQSAIGEVSSQPGLERGGTVHKVFRGAHWSGCFNEFNADFLASDWGDGYPLLPPTPERVDLLLSRLRRDPDEPIALVPPGNGSLTARTAATNACMAGCSAGETEVVIAALKAVASMRQPVGRGALVSTGAHAPLFVVNGPIAAKLGINGARCCLGPGRSNEVNIRIARGILLALKNIGRWYPGILDLDAIGTPRKFGMCIAENETESPWPPYHVSAGLERTANAVTVFFTSGDWDIGFQGHVSPQQLAGAIASQIFGVSMLGYMSALVGNMHDSEDGRLLLLAPEHARVLADGGFDKAGLRGFLHSMVREPVARMTESLRRQYNDGTVRPEWRWAFELEGTEAWTTFLAGIEHPELFHIVVAGSVRAKDLVLPTVTLPVTEPIVACDDGGGVVDGE